MIKRSILIALSLMFTLFVGAKVYDTVELKDGSVYEGYIAEQIPGKTLTINVEKAIISRKISDIIIVRKEDFLVRQLPREWYSWATQNKKYLKEINGEKYLTLWYSETVKDSVIHSESTENNDSVDDVSFDIEDYDNGYQHKIYPTEQHLILILERGKNIKYIDLTCGRETIDLSQVKQIYRSVRTGDELSSLVDIVKTRGNEVFRGQITNIISGICMKIFTDEGFLQTIGLEEIAEQSKERLNAEQTLFEQAPFLDIVKTNNNSYTGIIVKQDYGSQASPSYVIVQDKDGRESKILSSQITELKKIINDDYIPIMNITINDGDVYINREKINPVKCSLHKKNNYFIIDETVIDNHDVQQTDDGKLIVETSDSQENKKLILLNVAKRQIGKKLLYAFDYNDILSEVVPADSIKNINGKTLRVEYNVIRNNTYFLYNPAQMIGYFIEVK